MSDRLLSAAEYSLAYHLGQNMATVDAAYQAHPKFNWDKKPNGAARPLPFAAVRFIQEIDTFQQQDDGVIDPAMTFGVVVAADTHTELMQQVGDMQYALRNATATASGVSFWVEDYPGLPLYDKSDSNREVGVLQIDFSLGGEPVPPPSETQWNNLTHSAEFLVTLTPIYKDVTKSLL